MVLHFFAEQKPEKTTSCDNKPETSPVTTATGTCDNKTSKKGTWHEAQSAEGFTYYWNDSTDGEVRGMRTRGD